MIVGVSVVLKKTVTFQQRERKSSSDLCFKELKYSQPP